MPSPPLVSYQVVPPETGLDSGGSTSSIYSTYGYATLSDSPGDTVTVYGSDLDQHSLHGTTFVYVPQPGETQTIYSYETPKEEDEHLLLHSPDIYETSPTTVVGDVDNSTYAVLNAPTSTSYVQQATVSSNRSRQYIVTSSGNFDSAASSPQQSTTSSSQNQTCLIRSNSIGATTSSYQPQGAVYNRSNYVHKSVSSDTAQSSPVANGACSTSAALAIPSIAVSSSSALMSQSSSYLPSSTRSSSTYLQYVPLRQSIQKTSSSNEKKSKSTKKEPIDQAGVDEEVARNVSQILNASMNHRLSSSSSASSTRSYSSSTTSSSNNSSNSNATTSTSSFLGKKQHICPDCSKSVSSTRNLLRHRQSCKAALQPKPTAQLHISPASVPPVVKHEQPSTVSLQNVPQSAPATVESAPQMVYEEKPAVVAAPETLTFVSVSGSTAIALADGTSRVAYVQSVSTSVPQTHTYVPVVIKEQPVVPVIQQQVFEVQTHEVPMENGQQAAILYDQYVTDPNSYNLSDGPHCDDQLLDNAVADLLDNPLTEIDTSDLSALNPPISQSPVTTAPPMAPPQPSPMLPRSSEVSGQKTPEPSIHQCESCSKVVCSSRSLKRHRSTCKKYLDQFGHLLEDPQVKLSAIGTCTVKTGGTNVCEACSRQLCSASNLKRHRATCKAFQTNGDADTDATLGDEGESGQSDSLKSEVEETAKGTPKSAVSFDACSSTTDAMMSLSASISEKPWITVGEHLRAQHNQKQRELQQQRMSTGPTPKKPEFMIEDSKRIDRILADQDAVPSGRMAPTAELLMREIPSPAAPLASIITTEPLSPDRLSAAYGLRQDKPAEKAPSAAVLTAMKAAKPASLQASSAAKKESKDDLRYECPECSKTYSCRKNVKRHRMSVHKLTIEQLQKSKPVRVVVVSATDSSSVTTYAPAAGSAVSTNVVPKTKPVVNPASTSAPLNNPASSTDASSITVEVSSPVSFEIEASAPVSIVCEPVSTMEQWKEPAQMMQSPSFEIQLPQSSDAPVESSTFDGDLNDMDGCDYSKEILEKSKFSELAEADTTFSEEVDELGVRRPSFSKKYQTSLRSQKTLSVRQLNVSLPPPPAVSATPTSAVTQSLPPSPKIATKRTATSSASTSIAPRTAESKRPKPLHVCEACNKSLSSDYSLKRHKSTCVHYKAAMEAKSSSSNATVDENKTIESKEIGDVKTEEKPVAEISKTKVPDSETVTKTNSAALELKPEPIDPSFDYRWQDSLGSTVDSSADNGSAEASASDNADAEVSDCTDVQIEKKEEKSAEGEKTLSESLLCQEVLHDDFKQDIGEEWFDPSNVSSHPPVSADADSTTTSSSSSVKSDSVVVPKKENGTSSGTNSRKRAVWDESSDDQCDGCAVDSAYEEDEGAEDEDGKPSPKRIKIEPTEDQSTDFGKVTLPTAFTPHSLRENTVPAHINHSITSVIDGDAILYAGKYYFEIPKKFLINNSLVFRELSLTDATVDAFMLPDHISATAFESALGVLTKQVELDDENLESMLHVAARLKIVPLRRMCRDFIKSQIDETNLLWGIRLADQYELYSLKERLIESAKLEHLVDFHENEEYPNMSPKLRAELLARWSKFL